MPGIGPGGEPGHEIELSKDAADNLIGSVFLTQPVQLGHHLCKRPLDIADDAFRVVLALGIETALTANEFFAVKTGEGVENRIARRRRIGQEA